MTRLLAGALVCAGLAAAGYLGWRAAGARLTPDLTRKILEEGDQDLLAGRASEAERKFGRVAGADPRNARAAFGLGLALLRQGRHAEALEALDHAALLEPANADHAYVRAHTLALLGRKEEAVSAFQSLLKLDPDRVSAAVERINLLIEAGRWEEARLGANDALTHAPAHYALRILAGRIEGHLGAHDAAIEHYRRARQIRSYSPQPIYGLMEEYRDLGRLDESRALISVFEDLKSRTRDLEKLRADAVSHPSDPGPAALYVGRLLDDGRLDEGIEQADLFLSLFPESVQRRPLALRGAFAAARLGDVVSARRLLQIAQDGPALEGEDSLRAADVHVEIGDSAKARALYDEYLKTAPEDPHALAGIGRLSLRSGDLVQAEAALRRALRAAPQPADAHAVLGLVLVQKGDDAGGEAEMKGALATDPLQAEALFGLGFLAQQRREYPNAERYLREALDRKPGYTQARVVLALALSDQGRCEEAIPLFSRALESDYGNLTMHAGLVRCLELTGRTAEAQRARGIAERLIEPTPVPAP